MEDDERNYMMYEYKEVITEPRTMKGLIDGYKNFGWEFEKEITKKTGNVYPTDPNKIILQLRRNRKLVNITELTRLQRNFEACVKEISWLEKSKSSLASLYSSLTGVVGILFLMGAIVSWLSEPGHWFIGMVCIILGVFGCIQPYFIYNETKKEEEEEVLPLLESKYNEIQEICERGNKLLY